MTYDLTENQPLGERYTLLNRLGADARTESWLALDAQLSERVRIYVFAEPAGDDEFDAIQKAVADVRGLIHPNIERVYSWERIDGMDLLVTQHSNAAAAIQATDENWAAHWPLLEKVMLALEYAHGLGRAHGHLTLDTVNVDDKGEPLLTRFGLPVATATGGYRAADPSDDVFALGALLYRLMSGAEWTPGNAFDTPTPVTQEVKQTVLKMLDPSPYERPSLASVRQLLAQSAAPLGNVLERSNFKPAHGTRESGPGSAPLVDHRLPRERRVMSATTAFGLFAGLLVVAGIVFTLLPEDAGTLDAPVGHVAQREPAPETPAGAVAAQPEPLAPFEIARREKLKTEAADLARDLVRKQVELEDIGVRIWGRDRFEEIRAMALDADNLYREEQYADAISEFNAALTALDQLEQSADQILADSRQSGEEALLAGLDQEAMEAFTVVLAIRPDDQEAQLNLQRAENLRRVLDDMGEGTLLEDNGELASALASFQRAANLDPLYAPAGEAARRVQGKITELAFQTAMSTGFGLLDQRDYEGARASFDQAAEILPDRAGPADALAQVELREIRDQIDDLKETAEGQRAQEDWADLIATYEAVLALDESLVFASDGLAMARERLALEKDLLQYVLNPAVLLTDEALNAAKSTRAAAAEIAEPGKRLRGQIIALDKYITEARIPVTLELRSDKRTDVIIYRVTHLGKIASHKMDLYPGTYTIVGTRVGYRNVRHTVTLAAGRTLDPVFISCTEKI